MDQGFRKQLLRDPCDKVARRNAVQFHVTLASKYEQESKFSEALSELTTALFFNPTDAICHYNVGYMLFKMKRHVEAVTSLRTCMALANATFDVKMNSYNTIASIYREVKNYDLALYYLRRCESEQTGKGVGRLYAHIGLVLTELYRTDEARDYFDKALHCVTDAIELSALYVNIGHMHSRNGNVRASTSAYTKAIQLDPDNKIAYQNMLLSMLYRNQDERLLFDHHMGAFPPYPPAGAGVLSPSLGLRNVHPIRIGLVSEDIVDMHPVNFFISAFLKGHDQETFDVVVFSENIRGLSTQAASECIKNHRIDILIDLAGHTAQNRLDVFATRSAPIQISYIGYAFSTGLQNMDYKIVDHKCDQGSYSEKLLYMDRCFLCYGGNGGNASPIGGTANMVICCFNRLNKYCDEMFTVFNRILELDGGITLLFKTQAFSSINCTNLFYSKFKKKYRKRVITRSCTSNYMDHLNMYNEATLAIDTWPYSGTTTSCEALSMGVPVLTYVPTNCNIHRQHVTASILHYSDLDYYICESIDNLLLKIKDAMVSPPDKQEIRTKFQTGNVCDTVQFNNEFKKLLTSIVDQTRAVV